MGLEARRGAAGHEAGGVGRASPLARLAPLPHSQMVPRVGSTASQGSAASTKLLSTNLSPSIRKRGSTSTTCRRGGAEGRWWVWQAAGGAASRVPLLAPGCTRTHTERPRRQRRTRLQLAAALGLGGGEGEAGGEAAARGIDQRLEHGAVGLEQVQLGVRWEGWSGAGQRRNEPARRSSTATLHRAPSPLPSALAARQTAHLLAASGGELQAAVAHRAGLVTGRHGGVVVCRHVNHGAIGLRGWEGDQGRVSLAEPSAA